MCLATGHVCSNAWPQEVKRDSETADGQCAYWSSRYCLRKAPTVTQGADVPSFLDGVRDIVLKTGK